MLKITNLKNYKFRDSFGVYAFEGRNNYALQAEDGFVSLDGGKTIYTPAGGRKALQAIINGGGFIGEVAYIKPIN